MARGMTEDLNAISTDIYEDAIHSDNGEMVDLL